METEGIILQFIRAFLVIASAIKAYLIWKYFNKKALGMQTILDQVVKDFILIRIVDAIPSWTVTLKFENQPYDYYIALAIVTSFYFTTMATFFQMFVIVVIRYLSIFHHTMLNSVDEIKIIRTTRLFVGMMSLISTLLEAPWRGSLIADYITNKDVDIKNQLELKPLKFVIIMDLLFLVFVQVKVEFYNRMVDHQTESEEADEENQDGLEMNFKYRNNTIRIVMLLFFLGLCIALFWIFRIREDKIREEVKVRHLNRLWIFVLGQLIVLNIIPMILIKRNPNMYKFCVKQFQCLLFWK